MQPQQQFVNNNGGFYNPQPIPNESQPLEFYHELDSKFKSQIQGLIPNTEQIFYSGTIDKINKNLVSQKRILVITNRYLYNIRPEGEGLLASIIPPLSGARVQRKIDVASIFAASLSVRSQGNKNQFVLHVAGQYDYRYNGGENTEKIIRTIANIYNAAHNAPFIMYFIEETDLGRFHTTDDDLSLSVIKRPRDGKVLVTTEIMQKGLAWIIANRFAILQAQEAQKPQLKQADTLVKVKQQLYTNVPLGGGIVQVKPTIVIPVVPTIKIEQRPVTTIVYNPPVNVVTVGTTKVINLTNGVQTTTTYQPVMQTRPVISYQQQVPVQVQVQPTYQNQNIYNQQPSFNGNMQQNQYGPSPMMNQQQNYNNNNQYGGDNYNNNNSNNNNNNIGQNNQNNLSDLIGVSQQNVNINSNFENKNNNNKPF